MPSKLASKFLYKKRFDSFDTFKDHVASNLNSLITKSQKTNCTKCSKCKKSKHTMRYIYIYLLLLSSYNEKFFFKE